MLINTAGIQIFSGNLFGGIFQAIRVQCGGTAAGFFAQQLGRVFQLIGRFGASFYLSLPG